MNSVILVTLGHVDHGKTTLVKALTGIQTDKLKEEKERNLSIESTVANYVYNDKLYSFIDLPGHKNYRKNTIRGAFSGQIAILCVDVNESVMPQTIEHFKILNYLQIPHLIVVFTKSKNVDSNTKDKAYKDVENLLKGSIYEDCQKIFCDSLSKDNIEELKKAIESIAIKPVNNKIYKPRMFIDKHFVINGIGQVVTGTLNSGILNKDLNYSLYPENIKIDIKSLQTNGVSIQEGFAVSRVAISFKAPKKNIKEFISIEEENSIINTDVIDVVIKSLNPEKLKNNSKIQIYYFSSKIQGKLFLKSELKLDSKKNEFVTMAKIKLDKKINCKVNDHLLIYNFSSDEILSGAIVINPLGSKKIKTIQNYKNLNYRKYDFENIVSQIVENQLFLDLNLLNKIFSFKENFLKKLIDDFIEKQNYLIQGNLIVNKEKFYFYTEEILNYLKENLKLKRTDLPKLIKIYEEEYIKILIDNLLLKKFIEIENGELILNRPSKNDEYRQIVLDLLNKTPVEKIENICKDNENLKKYIKTIDKTVAVKLGKDYIISKSQLDIFVKEVENILSKSNKLTMSDIKEITKCNRKINIAFGEYLDFSRITRRIQDYRVKY